MASPSNNSGQGFRKLFAANVAFSGAFATPQFLAAATPSTLAGGNNGLVNAGQVVVDIGDAPAWPFLALRFFGTGSSGNTASVRISALRPVSNTGWISVALSGWTITLGSSAGNALGNALATDKYANQLTRLGTLGVDYQTDWNISPANDLTASVQIATFGSRYFLVEFTLNGGTASGINGEWTGTGS